jgi:hypothetical protein
MAMKRYLVTLVAAATGCGASLLYDHSVQAQSLAAACNAQCAQTKLDALGQKVNELEHALDKLALEMNKSVKNGQKIVLRTDSGRGGGCLTYIGPSGDQGGYVSWNVNCSRGTSWIINELIATTAQ